MAEIAYRSEISLVRNRGPWRTATLPAGETVEFGVHGAVAAHYGVSMEGMTPISTTLDYVVAAAAGWLTGTFGGALEKRDIDAGNGRLRCTAVGEIETEGGVLIIRRIHVTYQLQTDPDVDQAAIDRVMAHHAAACPVYRSLHPQIEITTSLQQV